MAKLEVGMLMMNAGCKAIRTGELVWVTELDEHTKKHWNPKLIITNKLGYKVKVEQDDLIEPRFFLHPTYGVVYLPEEALISLTTAYGDLSDIDFPVFTMFTESKTGYDKSIKKERVRYKDLIFLGTPNDLDRSEKYDKPKTK